MMVNLSKQITNKFDQHELAMVGLGMEGSTVDRHMANNTDIRMAVLGVLKEWKDSQPDRMSAYNKLSEVLKCVGMNLFSFL